ncbi:MAG: hypothetical protein J5552_04635 [Prevotella sp.]|nr:hypothetical protein [Prevotella sp.]
MNRIALYRLLRSNAKLSEKRSPALEQSKVAKVMMYIGACFLAAYLIFLGSIFGNLSVEEDTPEMMLFVLPLILIIDFLMRFMAQQTPMVFVKPYLLMPLHKEVVLESYLLTMVTSGYNFLWLCLLLPYAYLNLLAGVNFWAVLGIVVCGLLMVMINSQWYLLMRTLIGRSLLWWLLPIAVYAGAIALFVYMVENDILGILSDWFYFHPWGIWLLAVLLFVVLVLALQVNLKVQGRFIMQELSREQKAVKAIKHVSQFTFLERFGQAGEYLKLELKSIMRNKAIKARVMSSLFLIIILSVIITYTDAYNGKYILNFWCYYCFSLYGMTTLTKVMCPEGNYIDLLMTQRENILLLLRAKYYFHVAILLVPLIIMLPAVIAGKFTILMMLAYLLLTSGLAYCIMFQLAVYNKQTLPLDAKLTGKNNVESGLQLVIELVGMFLPLVLVGGLLLVFSDEVTYIIMALIGLVLTIAHPLWLRNIYQRMMLRKYENMEGFHASR